MGLRLARQMGLAPLPQLNPEPPEHPRAPWGVVGQWDEHKPGRPLSRVFPGCLCWIVPEGDGQRKTEEKFRFGIGIGIRMEEWEQCQLLSHPWGWLRVTG